jgi:carbon monoxide dehydrogenase subunit G
VKIEHTFEVRAGADAVFTALNDLELVVPCLPGARITGRADDGSFHGDLSVAFTRLRGTVAISASDPVTRTMELTTGHHSAQVWVAARDGVADVTAVADLAEIGALAFFGGLVQDLSGRLLRDFGNCLSTKLGAPSGADITAGRAAPEAALTDPSPPDPDTAAG